MSEEITETEKSKISFWIKVLSGILGLFITVGGIIFAMEARYAKTDKLEDQKTELSEKIELVSSDLLQTIQQDRRNANILFYNQLLEQSRDKETEIRQALQRHPNSSELQERLRQEKQKQQRYKDKIDKLLSN